jgi:hypothetical protein
MMQFLKVNVEASFADLTEMQMSESQELESSLRRFQRKLDELRESPSVD